MDLDIEMAEAKKKVKDLKKLRKMYKKVIRIQCQTYRPPVHVFVSDIVDTVCFTLKDLVVR